MPVSRYPADGGIVIVGTANIELYPCALRHVSEVQIGLIREVDIQLPNMQRPKASSSVQSYVGFLQRLGSEVCNYQFLKLRRTFDQGRGFATTDSICDIPKIINVGVAAKRVKLPQCTVCGEQLGQQVSRNPLNVDVQRLESATSARDDAL